MHTLSRDVWHFSQHICHQPGNRQNYYPLLLLYAWMGDITNSIDRLVMSYAWHYVYVALAGANKATVSSDSRNYFITLHIAGWVLSVLIHSSKYIVFTGHNASHKRITLLRYESWYKASHMWTTKTQISLHICPILSTSLLFTSQDYRIPTGIMPGAVAWSDAHPLVYGQSQVQSSCQATFFHGVRSWNNLYGHPLPSADSRRAVVSYWRKNVQ